jgi:hypothetical protein
MSLTKNPVWGSSSRLIVVAAVVVVAGCGSDDDASESSAKPAERGAPKELLGTYTTKLEPSDLPPNPAPELTSPHTTWTLTIANSGGAGNGRAFTIANTGLGPLESSSFGIRGDRILLHREECAAGGSVHLYENEYSYRLSGRTLTLETVKNSCKDKVAESILASGPWTKAD